MPIIGYYISSNKNYVNCNMTVSHPAITADQNSFEPEIWLISHASYDISHSVYILLVGFKLYKLFEFLRNLKK